MKTVKPKGFGYWADVAQRFIAVWQEPDPLDGAVPVGFCDNLAYALFVESLAELLYIAYRRGIRLEEKRRKARAVQKWKNTAFLSNGE